MTPHTHKVPRLPYAGSLQHRFVSEMGHFKIDGIYCRLIPLSRGFYTIVDESDFHFANQWKWSARQSKNGTWYAIRNAANLDGSHTTTTMHQVIMGRRHGFQIDHISTDGLDNRRKNFRWATAHQQMMNRGRQRNNTSGYKGVCYLSSRKLYVARIQVRRKGIHLGYFHRAQDAHQAYKEAAVLYFGEFARFE